MTAQNDLANPGALRFHRLQGTDGEHSLAELAGETGMAVVFIGTGCPTARAYEERLKALHEAWSQRGVPLVAINPNNPHLSPPDTLSVMQFRAKEQHYSFSYLKDDDGAIARGFGAICTPHAFLLNRDFKIVYAGRIDDSRLGNRVTSPDLQDAIENLVRDEPVVVPSTDPFGCVIVW